MCQLLFRFVELRKWTKCTKMTKKKVKSLYNEIKSVNEWLGEPLGRKLHTFIVGNMRECILIIPYTTFRLAITSSASLYTLFKQKALSGLTTMLVS